MSEFRRWKVAEINSAGGLHPFLFWLPNLAYSEYGSSHRSVRSEDLTCLSYVDGQFDLVITSETLEHVPDIEAALREIRRVLRPGGFHIFTVPYVNGRNTRTRANIVDGVVRHAMTPSFHGASGVEQPDMLVFHEFGDDFSDFCRNVGFSVRLVVDPANPAVGTFIAQKTDLSTQA